MMNEESIQSRSTSVGMASSMVWPKCNPAYKWNIIKDDRAIHFRDRISISLKGATPTFL